MLRFKEVENCFQSFNGSIITTSDLKSISWGSFTFRLYLHNSKTSLPYGLPAPAYPLGKQVVLPTQNAAFRHKWNNVNDYEPEGVQEWAEEGGTVEFH